MQLVDFFFASPRDLYILENSCVNTLNFERTVLFRQIQDSVPHGNYDFEKFLLVSVNVEID